MPDMDSNDRRDDSQNSNNQKRVKIGNYDVLLEELATGSLRLLKSPHVGNNRLEVLLLMNRSEYEESMTAGMDTTPILDKLIDIVTKQCVPPGRFLVSNREYDPDSKYEDYDWEEIEIGRARQFLTIALLDADNAGLAGFPSKSAEDRAAMPPPPAAGKNNNDDSKKRFRRSSLLRRSVSESFVRSVQSEERASIFGKKKTTARRNSSFWSSMRTPNNNAQKVEKAEDLDILFNFEQTALLPNHVGNNRLRILLNIHKEKYEKSGQEEQTSSLQEWIRTVTQFWGGRFLRQEEENAQTYEILDATQAELALHSVISELSPTADEVQSITSSQGKKLAIDSVAPPNLNVQDMRSAAVQSLQKRKKRQSLASRLRRLASNTLTRTPAAPTTGLHRTSSVPTQGSAGPASADLGGRNSSAPFYSRDVSSAPMRYTKEAPSGAMSLPTSPTPMDNDPPRNQSRARRSSSITLPRFLTGRQSLRRSQNLAADGVGRDLRESMQASDLDFGPEAFGELHHGER